MALRERVTALDLGVQDFLELSGIGLHLAVPEGFRQPGRSAWAKDRGRRVFAPDPTLPVHLADHSTPSGLLGTSLPGLRT
jgi:hypothetical protein